MRGIGGELVPAVSESRSDGVRLWANFFLISFFFLFLFMGLFVLLLSLLACRLLFRLCIIFFYFASIGLLCPYRSFVPLLSPLFALSTIEV